MPRRISNSHHGFVQCIHLLPFLIQWTYRAPLVVLRGQVAGEMVSINEDSVKLFALLVNIKIIIMNNQ